MATSNAGAFQYERWVPAASKGPRSRSTYAAPIRTSTSPRGVVDGEGVRRARLSPPDDVCGQAMIAAHVPRTRCWSPSFMKYAEQYSSRYEIWNDNIVRFFGFVLWSDGFICCRATQGRKRLTGYFLKNVLQKHAKIAKNGEESEAPSSAGPCRCRGPRRR